jgi:hypothetical protein
LSLNLTDERKLAELYPARRNRYYYGKLMDVLHFSLEQRYVLSKEWLYNRAVLGSGVVCGLDVQTVTTDAGHGLVIGGGLAIDGWGREIIVPEKVALVPLALTDQCGGPQPAKDGPLPSKLVVKICYAECLTDFAPAMVNDPDCGCGDDCEAGTVVETYCLKVLEGTAPPVEEPCVESVMKGLKNGNLHAVLCELSGTCAPDSDDPCLVLANVTVDPNGVLLVDSVAPRPVAPTNRILMALIRCLAQCCADHKDPPAETKPLMHVVGVKVLATKGQQKPDMPGLDVVGTLSPPSKQIAVSAAKRADVVELTFDRPYDKTTLVIGNSVQISPSGGDSLIFMPPTVVRVHRAERFKKGTTTAFKLFGTPTGSHQPIRSSDHTRLDGNFPASGAPGWQSGDGTEGDDFTFEVVVK